MTTTSVQTMREPYLVIDDFLPIAVAGQMRRDIENPYNRPIASLGDVNTCLETPPEKVIQRQHLELFMDVLRSWSATRLGLREVTWPSLRVYIDGCQQPLHNDAGNGRFGFVYSLTRDRRRTTGGQTILLREGDLFRRNIGAARARSDFVDAIEPRFNRLVVFDERLPHGVGRVDGSMDPVEGRVALHGCLQVAGPTVAGTLAEQQVGAIVAAAWSDFIKAAAARVRLYHGSVVARLEINALGQVDACTLLMDRVIATDAADIGWPKLAAELVARLKQCRFAEAAGPTVVIQPFLVGETFTRPQP